EHGGAFEVEGDRQLAIALGLLNLRHAAGQHEAVAMLGDPFAKAGDHPHHLADRVEIHPDMDRDVIGAGRAMALERGHALLRQQRQAGMRIPYQGGSMKLGGALGRHQSAAYSAFTATFCASARASGLTSARPNSFDSISKRSPSCVLIPSATDSVAVPKKWMCRSPGRRNRRYLKWCASRLSTVCDMFDSPLRNGFS